MSVPEVDGIVRKVSVHNILRHLFSTNIRKLQESLRNIYEKLRGFIRSGLSGKVTDEEDLEKP